MVLFVQLKLKVQPFSIHTLKVVGIIGAIVFLNSLFGFFGNAYVDAIIRSAIIVVLFIFSIYKLKVSKDINDFIDNFKNEHLKTVLPFLKKK